MSKREDRVGLLVMRASVDGRLPRRLLVQLLEVSPSGPDRVIGRVDSAADAARLVGEWLDSLQPPSEEDSPPETLEGDR